MPGNFNSNCCYFAFGNIRVEIPSLRVIFGTGREASVSRHDRMDLGSSNADFSIGKPFFDPASQPKVLLGHLPRQFSSSCPIGFHL